MIRGMSNISMPTIIHNAAQGGKMSFLVDSSSLIYSHFEYVSGIAAPDGTKGVSISRLNLLDVLIGQLNQLKKISSTQTSENQFEGVDALIQSLENQIRQAKAASEAMPYIPSPSAHSGAVLSLSV